MAYLSRRGFVARGLVAGALLPWVVRRAAAAEPAEVQFGFSLYGMKSLTLQAAVQVCAEIGYDSLELACLPGWAGAPENLSPAARRTLREQLVASRLSVASLMENLSPLVDERTHAVHLERLKRACELGHDLAPDSIPIVETVLGGKPAEWLQVRDRMVVRLREWAKVAESQKAIIALKPHVGGALHSPEGALWLMEQLQSPWLRLAYDYSHFQVRQLGLLPTLEPMLPKTAFIHVKDAEGTADQFQFLLPGDGKTNYAEYFQHLKQAGYRGPLVVEVSGQIHSLPGYEPIQAARRCYANLAPVLEKAGIRKQQA